jgi:hypothetical protein
VFVSSVNKTWASLSLVPPHTTYCQGMAANGISLFHHRSGRWHFVTAGSYFRCPIPHVPNRVAHDLTGQC